MTLGKSFDAFELEKEIMIDGLLIKERETCTCIHYNILSGS